MMQVQIQLKWKGGWKWMATVLLVIPHLDSIFAFAGVGIGA